MFSGKKVKHDDDGSSDESSAMTLDRSRSCDDDSNLPLDSEEELANHIDNMTEKKTAVRKSGLEGVCSMLAKKFCIDELEGKNETLMQQSLALIRKADGSEFQLACRCLGLQWITCSTDLHNHYEETLGMLQVIHKNRASTSTAGAILELMALLCFASCQDRPEIIQLMGFIQSRFSSTDAKEAQSALSSWGLLITMLSPGYLSERLDDWFVPLVNLVDHADLDTRAAAGQCLALLFSAHYAHADDADPDEISALPDTTELLQKIKSLISFSAKSTAKADRAKQKSHFRDYEEAIESGDCPSEVLKLRGQTIELDSWTAIKQMEFLRDVLQEGLQHHLEQNVFLRDVFGLGAPLDFSGPKERRSATDKRSLGHNSAEAKAKTQKRIKQRSNRTQRNSAAMADDD